jgi:hypothetical protein
MISFGNGCSQRQIWVTTTFFKHFWEVQGQKFKVHNVTIILRHIDNSVFVNETYPLNNLFYLFD